ncbi:outer membrane protein [Microvirga aerophila]|uniref:outer membrane protein n=1 Tax=Microvirga aerophila TaxID=670291 RepID=UPI000DEF5D3A|nr:outer membrane protein [Microvirga aerophila]
MKKILLSSVALLGLTAGAMAADLPSRRAPAPMIAAVPVFTWTGFYVGANAGYGWQNSEDNAIFVPAGTFGPGTAGGTITYADDSGEGFVGGGQIGYNYQMGSFVFGVEADLQWADLGGSGGTAFVPAGFPASFVPAGTAGGIDWFGTVRARAGVAFGQALVYATGGFAYGGADDNNDRFGLVNDDDVRTGWTLGGGVEYAFTNNLTLGLEGLWVNLDGDNNETFIGTTGAGATPVFVPGEDDDNEFFVARAKLNFKFGSY